MKVLFSTLHFANLRNFESVVRGLAERGHQVRLVADESETFGGQALVERLAGEYGNVSWGWSPSPATEPWFGFAQKVRYALDYVRFLAPEYRDAPKLRLRNIERTPRVVRWLTSALGATGAGSGVVAGLLKRLERRMPRSAAMQAFIESYRPDVLLLTSLTFSRSFGMEQMKAARALGIPTAACVMSWDHLSSKALLHIAPDLTLVWNPVQQQEAIAMHGLPADRVLATGAQCYDQWFERRPDRDRDTFCRHVGLDPARPIVLYVCSAMSPVPDPVEPQFVKAWVMALRGSDDPLLRDANVLVRPHPERLREWEGIELGDLEHVVVYGRSPIDPDARADYFDSLYFSSAVVGLCTSAFLEAAIVGRPVLTLLLPAYRLHQDGMAHFRYLLTVGGGLLHTASDLPGHVAQLGAAVRGSVSTGGSRDERNLAFLAAFIRPHGLDVPATPAFVAAVERLALARVNPNPELVPLVPSPLVHRLAVASADGFGRWLMMDAIDQARADGERRNELVKEEIVGARSSYRERKAQRRDQERRARQQQQQAKAWAKRRRGFSARKQVARLKGGLKQLIGAKNH